MSAVRTDDGARWAMLPLAVVALELARSTHSAGATLVVLGAALTGAIVGPRLAADRATQRVVGAVLVLLVIAALRSMDQPFGATPLPPFWIGVTAAAALVAGFRALCRDAEGGLRATLVVEALALLAAGAGHVGRAYAVAVLAFLVAMGHAMRRADPDRAPLRALSPSAFRVTALTLPISLGVAACVALPLRPAAEWIHRRALSAYDDAYARRGGRFSDEMRVGRIDPMLRSDAVTLRVKGPHVELLRAVVFDRYEDGRFVHARERPGVGAPVKPLGGGAGVIEVRRAKTALDRVPTSLGASDVAAGEPLLTEPFDVTRVPRGGEGKRYTFRPSSAGASDAWPPTSADLEVPAALRPMLERLARDWSGAARGPAAIVGALAAHLRGHYRYALGREHLRARDPIEDFLVEDPAGHCEYFAGALFLLARVRGVPTRLVEGYRVVERNPLDGHYVVRERNAHAWVEAWTSPSGWTTVDPTPLTEDLRDEADEPTSVAAIDLAEASWDRAADWLSDRSPLELAAAAVLGTILFVVVRVRRARRERDRAAVDPFGVGEVAAPYAIELFEALARRGKSKARGESLERFAERLDDEKTRALLLRYAAVRYGGRDDTGLPEAMRGCAEAWRARASSGAGA